VSKRPSVFILVRSLNVGGTERQVSVLAKALHERGYIVTIGVFYSGGVLEENLLKEGISIRSMNKKGRWDLIGWFFSYLKLIRDVNPDVIYSFLTTANIVATIGNLFIKKPVVWGIRASYVNFDKYDSLARFLSWLEKKLSRFVKTIIFNAQYSRTYHESLGYCLHNAIVVPNGIDTDVFKPDQDKRIQLRKEWGIPQDAQVIGMLARYDPLKDFETFLRAARTLLPHKPDLYFIIAGSGTDQAKWGSIPPRCIILGEWNDVPGLLNVLDIMVLCSFGEGFPNVIGEAMSCGVPTIATDVGDAAYIIGNHGLVIPPNNAEALIEAIRLQLEQKPLKDEIRAQIVKNFNVSQMVDKTLKTLKDASL
jgi:glycosyltransferase involved in cell wall biosynthesis